MIENLTPQELLWLRERVRMLLGLPVEPPRADGIRQSRLLHIERLAQSFIRLESED